MLSFLAAVFFLIATPGPGVLSTAGVGAAYGFRAGFGYVGGLWAGNNLVGLAVVSGLAALVFSVPYARPVLMTASTAYLLYLAAKIALSGSTLAFIRPQKAPGFAGGLALQAVNPKAYAVNTALFSSFPFLTSNLTAEIAIKFALMNLVWIPIHFLWLQSGVLLHRLDLPPRWHTGINIAMATSMLAVVALAAWSGLAQASG